MGVRGSLISTDSLALNPCIQCLKESFIKADGTGLSFGLQRLEFVPHDHWPPPVGVGAGLRCITVLCWVVSNVLLYMCAGGEGRFFAAFGWAVGGELGV